MRSISYFMGALVVFGLPVLLSVFIFELLSAQMYFETGNENMYAFVAFRVAHLFPAFFFAYISDKHYRKGALFISHLAGLIAVCAIYIFGFSFETLIVVAFVFNPLSVARAALLDNFPHYSPLKLMASVFIVRFLPWIFWDRLQLFGYTNWDILNITSGLFALNCIFIGLFFRDRKDLVKHPFVQRASVVFKDIWKKLVCLLAAFVFAQIPLRLAWNRLYYHLHADVIGWSDATSYSLIIGIFSAMLYKRLPHLSILTLTYVAGICMLLSLFIEDALGLARADYGFLTVINYYCVIGGMALPFAADAIITMFGTQKRASGAVFIDFSESMAIVIAAFASHVLNAVSQGVEMFALLCFCLASFLQKHIERRHVISQK